MESISEFVKRFEQNIHQYRAIEKHLGELCQDIFDHKNIRIVWQSRVKEASSLETKLRNRITQYDSDMQNIRDIKDLVGVRILLTRWRDIQLVKESLRENFSIREQNQHPKEAENTGSRKSRFQGYNAHHFYVTRRVPEDEQYGDREQTQHPKEAQNAGIKKSRLYDAHHFYLTQGVHEDEQYRDLVIEIQVMSLVMSAWSQLEHDFKYKQLHGELSENVHSVLEAIKGLANVQEVLLELFERCLDSNSEPFPLQLQDASFLAHIICNKKHFIHSELQWEHRKQDLERKCRQAFCTSDYERHKARNPDRVKGTCQWILQHPNFIRWRDSKTSNLIWISADAGCGKSVLAKSLIDQELRSTNSRTTCFFFFKDDNADQKSVTFALSALLHQLFSQNKELIKHAIPEFETNGSKLSHLFDSQWKVLTKATADPEAGEVICILDAIDECQDGKRETLIAALNRFYDNIILDDKPGPSLKILVTSRPYHDVGRHFKDLTLKFSTIRLAGENESKSISQEINLVIKERVRKIADDLDFPDAAPFLEKEISNKGDHRTYLWVHLILNVLEKSPTRTLKGLHELIGTLPDSVENAYTAILERSTDKKFARKLLHIVVAAVRPLTLHEMNVALVIRENHKSHEALDLEPETWFRTKVTELCGLFVSVIDSRIYLIHQTAKEFLMSGESNIEPSGHAVLAKWKQSLEPRESNLILAQACIWYLLFDVFERHPPIGNSYREYIKAHSFLEYAAENWMTHFQKANVESRSLNKSVAFKICDTRSGRFRSWYSAYVKGDGSFDLFSTNLMIATHFGLKTIVRLLLQKGVRIEAKDSDGNTALHYAARCWEDDIVQLLLKKGANIEATDCDGNTPLHHAVSSNTYFVVESLCKNGANLDAINKQKSSALYLAQENEAFQIMGLLINKGANHDLMDDGEEIPWDAMSLDIQSEDKNEELVPVSSPMEEDS